jgi:hypothetical protein
MSRVIMKTSTDDKNVRLLATLVYHSNIFSVKELFPGWLRWRKSTFSASDTNSFQLRREKLYVKYLLSFFFIYKNVVC